MGFIATDIVDRIPKDLKSLEIQVILMKNGFKSEKKEIDITPQAPRTSDAVEEAAKPRLKKCWRYIVKRMGKWFKHNGEWLEEMRGNLSLAATVISTITFQSVINPPGSFIQQGISISNNTSPLDCLEMEGGRACPGQAMLASTLPDEFRYFIINNTVAFMASLGATLLLISGLPLKNKVVMWVLSIGMCITLTALARTYFSAFVMITPDQLYASIGRIFSIADWTWLGLFLLVAGYILLAFLIWLAKKCIWIIKHIWMLMCGRNRSYGNGCCCI
ncbi:uncharacterized protein LOC129289384 [Prosopis cineraria]|uniref:uncharacterized protein LOC129289384 n=1 Tax=Prosopis cineraria TaxID=364024 RepID=UPI00240F84EC|nr:uncharacterized protein LOC129289384 [Prosopis cineraria]